jgi:hypothetical protein
VLEKRNWGMVATETYISSLPIQSIIVSTGGSGHRKRGGGQEG